MALTNEQMLEIVLLFGKCDRSYAATVATYNNTFQPEQPLTRKCVKSIVERLRDTGTFHPRPRSGRPRVQTGARQSERVVNLVTQNPHTSTRAVGAALGMGHQSVLIIQHTRRYHPYHVCLHQAMKESDPGHRLQFCGWLDGQLDEDPDFTKRILWTDEASFCRDGNVNLHNAHYWATANPHWLRTTNHQTQFRVNVWCGILNDAIVGPVFLPQHLNGARYMEFLTSDLENILECIPLQLERTMFFQQDGAPAHYHKHVRDYVHRRFPERWIVRGGPVP